MGNLQCKITLNSLKEMTEENVKHIFDYAKSVVAEVDKLKNQAIVSAKMELYVANTENLGDEGLSDLAKFIKSNDCENLTANEIFAQLFHDNRFLTYIKDLSENNNEDYTEAIEASEDAESDAHIAIVKTTEIVRPYHPRRTFTTAATYTVDGIQYTLKTAPEKQGKYKVKNTTNASEIFTEVANKIREAEREM